MKSQIENLQSKIENRPAFTLVELLVVVAIIVILLALLVPSMQKAIYQAELTVDGTQQKAIVGGALTYAVENKRYYFNRTVLVGGNSQPLYLSREEAGYDDRALLSPYTPLKLFRDPLAAQFPVDPNETTNPSRVHSSYELWFGVRFADYNGYSNSGMKKMGDRFSFFDDADFTGTRYKFNRFSVLTSDLDFSGFDRGVIFNAHPDSEGILALNTQSTRAGQAENHSRWATSTGTRGKTDSNYGYDDGSVIRLTGLTLDYDDRLAAVPYQTNNQNWSYYAVHIPLQ